MENVNVIKIPQGIDLKKLNFATEIYWLSLLLKENLIEQKEYLMLKAEITRKYM